MKKIVLMLCGVSPFFMSLQSMESAHSAIAVRVGVFSHPGCANKPQRDRYDLKALNGSIGVGVFDGNGGREVSHLLKQELFEEVAYFLENKNEEVKIALEKAIVLVEFDATDRSDVDKVVEQGSSLLASWF